jgi:exonuclease III|uniref:Craniofacial development protein 2 n=1 Tax=Sipha flava TaxID=143950 RepID=A0A2S2QFY1_9HEMI
MLEAGKIHNTINEMIRLNIYILTISEMRWPKSGKYQINEHTVYYSGEEDDNRHRNGVGIILNKDVNQSVNGFIPISERVLLIQLEAITNKMNIIATYAPTADCDEDLINNFYIDLNKALNYTKSRDTNLIMGDFNAKIGEGEISRVVGKFGLGTRNDRGEKLIQFCMENKLTVMNTCFKLPKRRLYTWKSPADTKEHVIRNQIDYILINNRYRNAIQSVKTYPGANVPSD